MSNDTIPELPEPDWIELAAKCGGHRSAFFPVGKSAAWSVTMTEEQLRAFYRAGVAAGMEKAAAEILMLRKIAAHVPALAYIKAKEAAGYGVEVKAK